MAQCDLHGAITVVGNTPFRVPSHSFIISPIEGGPQLYINSIVKDVVDPKPIDSLEDGDYTTILNTIPFTEFYVDTDETFYIRW